MSGLLPHRSAVFLDEMGVGPQWRLRARAAADAGVSAPAAAAVAADFAASAAAAPAVAAHAAAPTNAPMHAPAVAASPAVAPTPPAAQPQIPPPAPQSTVRDAAAPAAASSARADAVAWDDAAPAAPPSPPAPAPVPSPSTPAPAGGNEHSWFDDAPAPAPRAAGSSPGAAARPSERPPAAQPPAAQPPAARSAPAPADDDSTAWFDDAPTLDPARAPTAPAGHAAPAPSGHAEAAGRPTPAAPTARGPVSAEEIAAMDWSALQANVKTCTRCRLCETREAAVPGRGDENASWLILDTAPNQDDEEFAEPITANPGRLLDNMLRAVNQSTQNGAYITTLVKCRPSNADGSQRLPTQEELSACRPYLDRELELTQAKVVVALGHTTGKGLLGAAARGRIMLLEERTPVVATFHPADLLQRPEEKAKAWADLCLAKSAHAGRR